MSIRPFCNIIYIIYKNVPNPSAKSFGAMIVRKYN